MGSEMCIRDSYISDVDVIFVAEPADSRATRWAGEFINIGTRVFFEVDAALRPEGKQGALVRTLSSHKKYYDRWASTWEFQALLKARAMTGDVALGEKYVETLAPLVWSASEREDFVSDVQAMRRRVIENVPDDIRARELKLGPGGLRDVEFAVQLLQMVHGRTDESLRVRPTVAALKALMKEGYVGRDDGQKLIASYEYMRLLEHRLQLQRLKRTHTLPPKDELEALTWLARTSGHLPQGMNTYAEQLEDDVRRVGVQIHQLHSKLFYRPLLTSVAAMSEDTIRLTPDAAKRQLAALGYTRTPTAPTSTCPPWPQGLPESRSCRPSFCRRCWSGSPRPLIPTPGCWPTVASPMQPRRSSGSCGSYATKTWWASD